MKNKTKKYSTTIVVLVIIIVVCPFLVSLMMKLASSDNVWIGFWGSYLGSIISASAAFYILYIQRQDNHAENEQIINSQKKEIEYRQGMDWLNELRNSMTDNLASYEPTNVITIINLIYQEGKVNRDALFVINEIKRIQNNLIRTDSAVELLVTAQQNENLTLYNNVRKTSYLQYCQMLTDLQIIYINIYNQKEIDTSKHMLIINEDNDNLASDNLKKALNDNKDMNWEDKLQVVLNKMPYQFSENYKLIRQASLNCIRAEQERINGIL